MLSAVFSLFGCSRTEPDIPDDESDEYESESEPEDDGIFDVCSVMNDSDFIKYCLANFDVDGDGILTVEEAELIDTVTTDCKAADFTGIEYFTNLRSFSSTKAQTLDLSKNTLLDYLYLSGSKITSLGLKNNENLTVLPYEAFCNCSSLSSVTFPKTLRKIENRVFRECKIIYSLSNSSFYETELISIGDGAFYECNMKTIVFPDSLRTIGESAFSYCTYLTSAVAYKYSRQGNYMPLPDSLKTIGSNAFSNCTSLEWIVLPDSLKTIESETFYMCTSLDTVGFPKALTKIGAKAFCGCQNLSTIDLRDTKVTDIGEKAFYQVEDQYHANYQTNRGPALIFLPETLLSIGNYAFYCTKDATFLSYATTPPSLGSGAFTSSMWYEPSKKLYVPAENVEDYEASDWSGYFVSILPLDEYDEN